MSEPTSEPTPIPTPANSGIPQHREPQVPAPAFDFAQFQAQLAERDRQIQALTGQFQTAQTTLQQLQAEREERDRLAAEAQQAKDEEARKAREEEMSLRELMEKREQEYNQRFSQMDAEIQRRDALLAKEREFAELERYKAQRIAELAEPDPANGHFGIAPQLRDLIVGSSKEAIDASINTMVAKTGAILKEMQQATQAAARAIPGVSPTAGNIGIMDQQDQTRNYSPEDIHGLAPGSEEHMRLRAAYGIAGRGSGQGMFGLSVNQKRPGNGRRQTPRSE